MSTSDENLQNRLEIDFYGKIIDFLEFLEDFKIYLKISRLMGLIFDDFNFFMN